MELNYRITCRYFYSISLVIISSLFIVGCASISRTVKTLIPKKQVFTNTTFSELNEAGFDINGVLFYSDREIVLNRLSNDSRTQEKNNRGVYVEKGKIEYENKELSSKSSGIITDFTDETVKIKFAENGYLTFNVKYNSQGSDQRFVFNPDDSIIMFDGHEWHVTSGVGAVLNYKITKRSRQTLKVSKVRGVKSDGTEKKSISLP